MDVNPGESPVRRARRQPCPRAAGAQGAVFIRPRGPGRGPAVSAVGRALASAPQPPSVAAVTCPHRLGAAKLPCFIDGETRNSTQRLSRPAQPLPGPVHAAHALRAPATGRHAPPAATHSLVQCCHLSRGDSDSLFVSPLPPWPRARFQKELSKMQPGFSLVCEMLPGWPLPPWESVSSCRGGGRQGRGLPPRAHFPSVQSPGCLLPIPCVCHLPREALRASPLVSRVAGVSLRHGL